MNKEILKNMIDMGYTQKQIAEKSNKSVSGAVYWLNKYNLKVNRKPRRTSIVWTIPKKDLVKIVSESQSLADILRKLGYNNHLNSALYRPLKERIKIDNIDISHINLGLGSNKNRIFKHTRRKHTKKSFVEKLKKSKHLSYADKQKLIFFNLIPSENCSVCGQSRIWNNKSLVLQVDHIDGNSKNNNIENLRFVCPNCHTQTDTFCSKNKKNKIENRCKNCGKNISKGAKRCAECSLKNRKSQPEKLVIDESVLKKIVWEKPTKDIAKEYGVSDKTIENRCKKLGIKKPPRGYWNRINSGISHEYALNPPTKVINDKFKKDILSDEDVLIIHKLLNEGKLTMENIAQKYGRSRTCVNKIKYRRGNYGKILEKYGL